MQRISQLTKESVAAEIKITKKKIIEIAAVVALFLFALIVCISQKISIGQEFYRVYFNGVEIGCVDTEKDIKSLLLAKRRELALGTEEKLCMDYSFDTAVSDELFVDLMTEAELEQVLEDKLQASVLQDKGRSYAVSIEGYHGNFSDMEETLEFFDRVKNASDTEGQFVTTISKTDSHISGLWTAYITESNPQEECEVIPEPDMADELSAGVVADAMYSLEYAKANPVDNSYEVGTLDMEFIEEIAVYETYIDKNNYSDLETELIEVTKQKETNKIYVVESGDCLSVIANNHDMKLSELMLLNGMENENVSIVPGEEMIVAVPEPDLSLRVMVGVVYEEDYEEEPIIIPNDSWYTTTEVVLEEGTIGHRERNDMVTYENGIERNRELIHQTIMVESKPAVIERGTITPPTYIRPISGGRFTSGFGRRWGRMHKGVDWAVPVGTSIWASSDGVVLSACYSGAYGNMVLISHPDGRMTRYAHCSKLLVSAGQSVEQGEIIAKSGNTGRSTGPHLHFEMIINGSAVNPLDYLN